MNKKRWYVWDVDNVKVSTGVFGTKEEAVNAAKNRCAKEQRVFEVLEVVTSCSPPAADLVVVTDVSDNADVKA